MRKLGFIIGIIVLLMVLMPLSMPVSNSLPAQAAEPPVPVPTEAPSLPPPPELPPVIDGHGTGFIPPTMDLSYITGQRMPDGSLVGGSPPVGLPQTFDWRNLPGKVTSVKNQLACGACYAFAGIGNVESKILVDNAATLPDPDYSENNAKSCTWRAINNWTDPWGYTWGNCYGGNYYILASLFSQKGIVDETADPYVAQNTLCNSSCPYNKTLLDWRIISGNAVPITDALKTYIMTYGPVYTTLFVDPSKFNGTYDGSYTFNYNVSPSESPNHAVLIVGWSNLLPHVPGSPPGTTADGWIVKNSWGPLWGAGGYFYITYGAANIGKYSSFMYNWQNYDNNGSIMYYDDDCWDASWGYSSTTAWGLCNFTPINNTYATRVEFWTTDATTDVDIYIYDDFDGTSLSNLLVNQTNYSFTEAGYHGVNLTSPLPLTAGDPVIVVVKFTDVSYNWPVPSDPNAPWETGRTYMSPSGANGTWYDLGYYQQDDVAIRLRTSGVQNVTYYNLTMAVNGTGTTTPAVGSHSYAAGTVNITATAGAGWQFVNWTTANIAEIANPAAASTTVTVDENKTVTANFALSPGWYWKPGNWTDYALSGMPDFDQKQDMWQNPPVPAGAWSYCGPVSVANSLWWFDSRNETSPVPPPTINDHYGLVTNFSNPWDDHCTQNVMPLVNNLAWLMDTDGNRTGISHNGTDVMDMQAGIAQYLNNTGYAAAYNETTVLRPDFNLFIEPEVERCEDVVLLLGFWQHEYGSDYWWRVGGHYVTVAGVNSNTSQLGISDPYYDNAEAGGAGVVPMSHAYPHGATVHNDTQYVSHDIYNVTFIIPGPGGSPWPCWALQNYAGGNPIVNFLGQNSGANLIPQGPYQQAFPVMTIIDYAVAVSPITGATATLEGHVTFSGRGAAPCSTWIEAFEVKGFESGNLSHVLWTTNATTNNTGVFTVTGLTPGTYDISIKNWTCLSEKVAGVTLSAGVTTVVDFGTPREGDSNNDDWITGADRSILYSDWGKAVPPGTWHADFNRDGWLTGADRSFMYTNWGQKGDLIP
jgi:C1A family cysteine protease